LVANPPRDIEFKIRIDLAELCIKLAEKTKDKEREEFFKKAKEACDPVLWKDPGGPLFGKALMILAHMEMIKGDKVAAKKLIATYMPMLKELERVLKENNISLDFSPMAECRYLLATIAEDEAKEFLKKGQKKEAQDALIVALTHFVNVVAKYQTGQWAVPSSEGQERIMGILKQQFNLVPQVPSFPKDQILKSLLKEAQSLFEQNLFLDASKKYLIYVNSVPENDTSVAALGELTKCYIELGNTNYFEIVLGYLAERFYSHPQLEDNAGNAILRAAASAETLNNKELRQKIYDYYFKYFKSHRRMAGTLYQFGDSKVKEKNYDQAMDYFQEIATNSLYAKSAVFFPALSKLAYCYTMLNDYSNTVQVLSKTIAALPPGPEEIETKYRLAETYRRMDQIVPSINEFVGIINAVNGTNKAAYAKTAEDVTRVKGVMEGVYFWKAYGYALLNKGYPPDKVKEFQQKALDDFAKFVADYPKSVLAPTALIRLGSLLYAFGKSDEANKIFDRLVKEYPDAPESKDVVFVQGMSLIEMKQMPKAIEVFGKMLANEKAFTAPQFLRVGKIMFDAKEYPTAVKFYERAKALGTKGKAVDRTIWEPAVYGIAEAYFTQGNSAEAAKAIEELFSKYQKTPRFADASFILSKSYAELGSKESDNIKKQGLFVKARATIAKGMSSITNEVMKFQANLQIADMQILMGEKDAATASYYRMLSFGDWNNADLRPHMENALEKGLPLINEKGMFENVVTIATRYLAACPRGRLIREAARLRDAAKLKLAMSGRKMTEETGLAPVTVPPPAPAAETETGVTNAAPTPPAAAAQGTETKPAGQAVPPKGN
ncbi:MAG: tetratricopeptide repeat protein, partial [Kiritimatiellae bacterium]|nr:tetratricopeptide repeat protein [Kiritimatiellia bacterium]